MQLFKKPDPTRTDYILKFFILPLSDLVFGTLSCL